MALTELSGQLGEKNAAHLLRRATFGPTIDQIIDFSTKTVATAMSDLFDDSAPDPNPPIDTATGSSWVLPTQAHATGANSEQDTLHGYFKAWHTDVMLQSGATIKERITWFYHTHLPARWTRIRSSEAIYYQNCVFRYYALGSFKELFKKICVDNAMLKYLDGGTNKKNNPNENFAREMLELYSIGRGERAGEEDYGTFTETDVKEATKVLTGWEFDTDFATIDPDHDWPTGKMTGSGGTADMHDSTNKTFTHRFNNAVITGESTVTGAHAELGNMIDMIFEQEATAKAIVRKLYRFFVYHFISEDIETNIITPLATTLMDNNYEIHVVLKELFSSQFFYDANNTETSDDNIGGLIKSPVDLALGSLRFFETATPDRDSETSAFYTDFMNGILPRFEEQGLYYYEPFEVAGYPPYHQKPAYGRNWIMPSELAYRYQIGERLMQRSGYPTDFSFKIDVVDWLENTSHITDVTNANEIVSVLTTYLLAVDIDGDRETFFRENIFLNNSSIDWGSEWSTYSGGGSDNTVRTQLEALVSAIMQSPEYQIH